MKIPFVHVVTQHLAHTLLVMLLLVSAVVFAEDRNDSANVFNLKVDAESILSSYQLNTGDKIKIQVFGEADLTLEEIRLSDAGTISYPFMGEIRVKGLTTSQIEKLITDKLDGDYLIDPKVSVTVLEYREFYVNGEVEKPGSYPYTPGLTVRKAVSIAGGFSKYANKNTVLLIREFGENKQEITVETDATVLPGDIVNVKETFF